MSAVKRCSHCHATSGEAATVCALCGGREFHPVPESRVAEWVGQQRAVREMTSHEPTEKCARAGRHPTSECGYFVVPQAPAVERGRTERGGVAAIALAVIEWLTNRGGFGIRQAPLWRAREEIVEEFMEAHDHLEGDDRRMSDQEREAYEQEIAGLRMRLRTAQDAVAGNLWFFTGNGEDDLDNLTCPVVIQPAELERLLQLARRRITCGGCGARYDEIPGIDERGRREHDRIAQEHSYQCAPRGQHA